MAIRRMNQSLLFLNIFLYNEHHEEALKRRFFLEHQQIYFFVQNFFANSIPHKINGRNLIDVEINKIRRIFYFISKYNRKMQIFLHYNKITLSSLEAGANHRHYKKIPRYFSSAESPNSAQLNQNNCSSIWKIESIRLFVLLRKHENFQRPWLASLYYLMPR